MDDKLILGLPNDAEANAPQRRFDLREQKSRLNSFVLPFFVATWAILLKHFAEDKSHANGSPKDLAGASVPNPSQAQDATPAPGERPPAHAGYFDNIKMLTMSSPHDSGSLGAVTDPSNFHFVRTPLPQLNVRPPFTQTDQPPTLARPSNDNARPFGGGGGGGGKSENHGSQTEQSPAQAGNEAGSGHPGTGPDASSNSAGTSPAGPPASSGSGEAQGGGTATPPTVNRRPLLSGPVYLDDGRINESIIISIAALLTNASDPDGDSLGVLSLQADSGILQPLDSERWLFTPTQDAVETVTFHYAVTDGIEPVAQTAYVNFIAPSGGEITGTGVDDVLIGTPRNDVIVALGGNDIVYGREGDDMIHGGAGNNRLLGGEGNDVIFGGPGNDFISGGAGNDTLFGGDGNDTLMGDAGNDLLFGDAGDDSADGGEGNDIIDGGAGNDVLNGDTGDDTLDGGNGDDQLCGDSGNDRLFGDAGDDHLFGGDGNDTLDGGTGRNTIQGDRGDDVIMLRSGSDFNIVSGGEGSDTIDLSNMVFDSTVDIPDGIVIIDGTESATIFEIENVRGGSGRDKLIADEHTNIMVGGAGNDTFVFGSLTSMLNDGGPRDHIMDFSLGDRLDLSRINLESEDFAGRKLFFAGAASANFQDIGAVSYHFEILSDNQEVTIVTGNLNADDAPEFEIVLDGHHDLTQADFIIATPAHDATQQHG